MNFDSFLSGKYKISDLELLPWPVIITDYKGSVIYKNEFAYKIKLIRKSMNFLKLISPSDTDIFLECIKQEKSRIFKCRPDLGVSHAAVIGVNGVAVIFLTICSIIIRDVFNYNSPESEHQAFSANERIISAYQEMCSKLKKVSDPAAKELLRCNSMRFSRAARHFSMYTHALTKTENFENNSFCDIEKICTSLIKYFSQKVTPLGYRLNIEIAGHLNATVVQKYTFICVFLELVALSLRISINYACNIKIYEQDEKIHINYDFQSVSKSAAEANFYLEFDFLKSICSHCGWDFSGLNVFDGEEASFHLAIPVIKDKNISVSATCPSDTFELNAMFEIADEAFTLLYFS